MFFIIIPPKKNHTILQQLPTSKSWSRAELVRGDSRRYCWQMSLVMLGAIPLMVLANAIQMMVLLLSLANDRKKGVGFLMETMQPYEMVIGCWLFVVVVFAAVVVVVVVAGAGAVALSLFCTIDWQDSWRNY